jgi:hypothetical protein
MGMGFEYSLYLIKQENKEELIQINIEKNDNRGARGERRGRKKI